MAKATIPDRLTLGFIRGVMLADDREWFLTNPDATHRRRRYVHGEFGFGPEVQWWLAEAREARDQIHDELGWTDGEVYIVVVVRPAPRGLHREFGYVAVERTSIGFGWGLVPTRGGVSG